MTAQLPQFVRRHRIALGLAVAVLASILSMYRPTLLPPGLESRSIQVGAAATELMVAPTDMRIGTGNTYVTAVDHAVLLGDVMVTPPVIDYAAGRLGIRPNEIQTTAPMTANVPRVVSDPGSGEAAYDLVRSDARYKLEVQADPSIPILHLYTQAPTTALAIRLAREATNGLIRFASTELPSSPDTATEIQVLGPINGAVANSGAGVEIPLLVFVGTFGIVVWLTVLITRIAGGDGGRGPVDTGSVQPGRARPDVSTAARSARG